MPIKKVSHDEHGMLTRVPVKHKVSLGYPKGYKLKPNSRPLPAPQKLFHFLLQSRNKDGEWGYDKKLADRVLNQGDKKEPTELNIQLVGNDIKDMVLSNLFYWDSSVGVKCSCGTLKFYLEQWCEENDISWEPPLSDVRSESEIKLLLSEEKIPRRIGRFLEVAEKLIKNYSKKLSVYSMDIQVSDVIGSTLAERRVHGEYKSFPCLFRKCPDYVFERCKYNGRFFFVFDGDDIGEIAILVTTSPKNIRNIQWGLDNIIRKVVRGRKAKDLSMHGISCRLIGITERGMYAGDDGKQHSTKFFVISIKGPKDKMIESASMILSQAKEMAKLYPGGLEVRFDEGDTITLAKERLDEFTERQAPQIKVQSGTGEFRVFDEKPGKEISKVGVKDKLLKIAEDVFKDKELIYMIRILCTAVDKLPDSNGRLVLVKSLENAIKTKILSVEKILSAQNYIKNLGSDVDLETELKEFKNKRRE